MNNLGSYTTDTCRSGRGGGQRGVGVRGRKTSRWTDEQEMKVTDELRGKEEEKRGGRGEEWYMIANICLGITRQCSCLNNKTGRGGL